MEIIATLPSPHLEDDLNEIVKNPNVNLFRFNTGTRTPYSPKETIQRILAEVPKEKLIIDLKGRQLRIDMWAVPTYGDIILNREIEVDLPARIYLRNGEILNIVVLQGRKIFVNPRPRHMLGAGQALNIHGNNFKVLGDYLTDTDKQYIEAGKELGVNKFMLSFSEKTNDIAEVLAINPEVEIYLKIESEPGLELIKNGSWSGEKIGLIAARDDLFINVGFDAKKMFEALKLIIEKDPKAIVASRILTSLSGGEVPELSDLSDISLMQKMGYQRFLLSDGLCSRLPVFKKAVTILRNFQEADK